MIPSWLQGTDVIGAMSRGASAGLSARSEDDSERNAADRLRLAYDQMAQEERRQSQAAQIHQQQTAAALLLKKQQAEMLNTYRQGELATRSAAQALQAKHFDELKRHNMAMEGKPRLHNVPGVGLVQEDVDGNVDVVMPAKDKAETERQKDQSILSAAKVLGGDSSQPGFPIASNAAWNVLNKYNALPPTNSPPNNDSSGAFWTKFAGGFGKSLPKTSSPAAITLLSAQPKQVSTPGVKFTDKSGKTFRYIGDSPNPKLDKNPDHWVEE